MSSARPRVALATYERAPDLAPDDRPLAAALAARGLEPVAAAWSDASVDWESADLIVIRSCWDYHLRLAEFEDWIDRVARMGVSVLNSPVLIRWNSDKRYLLDLSARGVPTVPTALLPTGGTAGVARELAARNWKKFVLKPAVSASGYETHLLEQPLSEAGAATVDRVTALGPTLIQPFVEEVSQFGELSFTFIDGKYSHASLKTARAGEFRVQTDHGGRTEPFSPGIQLVDQAAAVVAKLPETPLYARVDAVVRMRQLLLMELELIEPNLFLEHGPGAADRLADAIVSRLAR